MSYKIVNNYVPQSKYRIKATYAMKPKYITIHNTANTASARNEVAYMIRNNNMTSYHVAIDDKEAVQAIPFSRNAWHCGDGAGQGNRASIGIEICYSMDNGYRGAKSARYMKAEENAALYVAHVLKQYGWGVDRLRQHWNWSRKDCPHKMRAHNSWNWFKNRVQAHLNALNGKKPASKPKPSQPKPSTGGKSVDAMAREVMAGRHGSGHANRQRSLGVSNAVYQQVRNRVNQLAGVSTPSKPQGKSIDQMAREVIQGRHGSGHANRQRSLGVNNATYQKVRNRVNQLM